MRMTNKHVTLIVAEQTWNLTEAAWENTLKVPMFDCVGVFDPSQVKLPNHCPAEEQRRTAKSKAGK